VLRRPELVSASAAQGATLGNTGQQVRSPLTKGVHTGYSYALASLRSEGGNNPVDWVATILWTGWQYSHGLPGNIPVDWVAEKSVEYAIQ